MTAFGVSRSPRNIVFGKGQRGALGLSAKALGSRALICTDERLGGEPWFRAMVDDLTANGVGVQVYDRTIAELPLSCLDECTAAARPFGPDLVIGIGGGSCMDLAKVAALMLTHGGDIRSYYGEFKVPGPVLPLICVPTTSGTGSEVTPVAVLGDPERAMKVGVASPRLISHTAICDPELTYSCPPGLTAISGADALTHAIEAFTAMQRPATPQLPHQHVFIGKNLFSDRYALYAIELIARSLPRAVANGDDEAAREDLMLGALSAGLAFGTAGTAAAHAIQYPVGAMTHTPHGTGVALLMPYVMDFNRGACRDEFAAIAVAMGAKHSGQSADALAADAIDRVRRLFKEIGLPATLAELSVPADRLDWIAENAMSSQRLIKNNPVSLDVAGLRRIIDAAYHGSPMQDAA
ncbi:iron-containing alcohol dehydrogenase [Rhodopseudomonas palustris]|uniref:Alcohol dehydrogenase n=1 Tax=Rhodopseudomonas palustris (strain BisB18) TaxID=316056 RepID=Q21D52_RHOPB